MEVELAGPVPPNDFQDNGCGPKTRLGLLMRLIPDGIRRFLVGKKYDWSLACRYHDYHWKLAAKGREGMTYGKADRLLRVNMQRLLASQGATRYWRFLLSGLYWTGVRIGSALRLAEWA